MKEVFERYLQHFDLTNPDIKKKQIHTYQVAENCLEIAKSLGLSEQDQILAYQIGILHDIGRFHQLELTNSYDDQVFDHADYGAQLLFDQGLISTFPVRVGNYEVVRKAIVNHNKYEIEDGLEERTKLFCKLIRDADKIDILELSCDGMIQTRLDGPASPDILMQLERHQSAKVTQIRSNIDRILIRIGFFYNLYFLPSMQIVFDREIVKRLEDKIEDDIVHRELERAQRYLKERLKC